MDNIRLIKIPIPNSSRNVSNADGFRLIVCCNRKYKPVTFLTAFSKRGKLYQLDQHKEEYKRQLRMCLESFQPKNFN